MADEIECRLCGAIYVRTYQHVIMRDRDHIDCRVCGAWLDSWDGSSIPSYRLIERGHGRNRKSVQGT